MRIDSGQAHQSDDSQSSRQESSEEFGALRLGSKSVVREVKLKGLEIREVGKKRSSGPQNGSETFEYAVYMRNMCQEKVHTRRVTSAEGH